MPHADEHENESENVNESVNVSESESVNESVSVTESATVTETGRHGAAAHALGLALVRPHEEDDEAHARGHAALRLHDETRGDRGQNRAQGRRRAAAAGGTRTRKRISTGTRKRTMNQVRDDRKRMHSRSVTNFLLLLSLRIPTHRPQRLKILMCVLYVVFVRVACLCIDTQTLRCSKIKHMIHTTGTFSQFLSISYFPR